MSRLIQDSYFVQPKIAGLDSAIAWLADHGVSGPHLASLFGTNSNHIRQLVYDGRRGSPKHPVDLRLTVPLFPPADPFEVPSDDLREWLGVRKSEDANSLYVASKRKLNVVEEELETLSSDFWSGVPYGRGIERLRLLRTKMGRPGHHRWIRLVARLYHLISETFLHSGRAASALSYAVQSLHLYRISYHESTGEGVVIPPGCTPKDDLIEFADVALIASQAHLLRLEPGPAQEYLDLHVAAVQRAGSPSSPDYFRQQGAVLFQKGLNQPAWNFFEDAMKALTRAAEAGAPFKQYEILTFGQRHQNLLTPSSWERAQELVDELLLVIPAGDIRIAMNVNWSAACGLGIDSSTAQRQALDLLERHSASAAGFGHQATVARLLAIAPDLPPRVRPGWVRRVLYENALRNR